MEKTVKFRDELRHPAVNGVGTSAVGAEPSFGHDIVNLKEQVEMFMRSIEEHDSTLRSDQKSERSAAQETEMRPGNVIYFPRNEGVGAAVVYEGAGPSKQRVSWSSSRSGGGGSPLPRETDLVSLLGEKNHEILRLRHQCDELLATVGRMNIRTHKAGDALQGAEAKAAALQRLLQQEAERHAETLVDLNTLGDRCEREAEVHAKALLELDSLRAKCKELTEAAGERIEEMKRMRMEADKLKEERDALQTTLVERNAKLEELDGGEQRRRDESEQHGRASVELFALVKELKEDLQVKEVSKGALQSVVAALREDIARRQKTEDQANAIIAELRQQIEEKNSRLSVVNGVLEAIQPQGSQGEERVQMKLLEEIRELKQEIEVSEQQREGLQMELEALRSENTALVAQVGVHNTEMQEINESLHTLREDVLSKSEVDEERLEMQQQQQDQAQQREARMSVAFMLINVLKRDVEEAIVSRDALQTGVQEAMLEIDTLRQNVGAVTDMHQINQSLQTLREEVHSKAEEVRQSTQKQQQDQALQRVARMSVALMLINELKRGLEEASVSRDALQVGFESAIQEIEVLRQNLRAVTVTGDAVLQSNELHHSEIALELSAATAARDALQSSLARAQENEAVLKQEIRELTECKEGLQNNLEEAHQNEMAFQQEVHELNACRKALQGNVEQAHQSEMALKQELSALTLSRDRLQSNVEAAYQKEIALIEDIRELSASRDSLQRQIEEANKNEIPLKLHIRELVAANEDLESIVEDVHKTQLALEQEIAALKCSIVAAQQKEVVLNQEIIALTTSRDVLQLSIEEAQQQQVLHRRDLQDLRKQCDELELQNGFLCEDLERKDVNLRQIMVQAGQNKRLREEELRVLTERTGETERELRQQVQQLQDELRLSVEMREVDRENDIIALSNVLEQKGAEIEKAVRLCEQSQNEAAALRAHLLNLQRPAAAVLCAVDEIKAEVDELRLAYAEQQTGMFSSWQNEIFSSRQNLTISIADDDSDVDDDDELDSDDEEGSTQNYAQELLEVTAQSVMRYTIGAWSALCTGKRQFERGLFGWKFPQTILRTYFFAWSFLCASKQQMRLCASRLATRSARWLKKQVFTAWPYAGRSNDERRTFMTETAVINSCRARQRQVIKQMLGTWRRAIARDRMVQILGTVVGTRQTRACLWRALSIWRGVCRRHSTTYRIAVYNRVMYVMRKIRGRMEGNVWHAWLAVMRECRMTRRGYSALRRRGMVKIVAVAFAGWSASVSRHHAEIVLVCRVSARSHQRRCVAAFGAWANRFFWDKTPQSLVTRGLFRVHARFLRRVIQRWHEVGLTRSRFIRACVLVIGKRTRAAVRLALQGWAQVMDDDNSSWEKVDTPDMKSMRVVLVCICKWRLVVIRSRALKSMSLSLMTRSSHALVRLSFSTLQHVTISNRLHANTQARVAAGANTRLLRSAIKTWQLTVWRTAQLRQVLGTWVGGAENRLKNEVWAQWCWWVDCHVQARARIAATEWIHLAKVVVSGWRHVCWRTVRLRKLFGSWMGSVECRVKVDAWAQWCRWKRSQSNARARITEVVRVHLLRIAMQVWRHRCWRRARLCRLLGCWMGSSDVQLKISVLARWQRKVANKRKDMVLGTRLLSRRLCKRLHSWVKFTRRQGKQNSEFVVRRMQTMQNFKLFLSFFLHWSAYPGIVQAARRSAGVCSRFRSSFSTIRHLCAWRIECFHACAGRGCWVPARRQLLPRVWMTIGRVTFRSWHLLAEGRRMHVLVALSRVKLCLMSWRWVSDIKLVCRSFARQSNRERKSRVLYEWKLQVVREDSEDESQLGAVWDHLSTRILARAVAKQAVKSLSEMYQHTLGDSNGPRTQHTPSFRDSNGPRTLAISRTSAKLPWHDENPPVSPRSRLLRPTSSPSLVRQQSIRDAATSTFTNTPPATPSTRQSTPVQVMSAEQARVQLAQRLVRQQEGCKHEDGVRGAVLRLTRNKSSQIGSGSTGGSASTGKMGVGEDANWWKLRDGAKTMHPRPWRT